MRTAPLVLCWMLAALCPPARGNEVLINLTNQAWRYDQSATDLAASGWQNPGYDDAWWAEGRGVFAYETSQTAALFQNVYPYTNTVLRLGPITVYFRTHFTFNGDPSKTVLMASNLVDDGYVMYLNGTEVGKFNMVPGPVSYSTMASVGSPMGEGTYLVRQLAAGALINGDNVLAVEVHQSSASSADVVWGAVLHASAAYAPMFLSPTNRYTNSVLQGRSTNLSVVVDAAPGATLQWYKDDEAIPGANGANFAIAAMAASDAGVYWCAAANSMGSTQSPRVTLHYVADESPPAFLSVEGDPWDLTKIMLRFDEPVANGTDTYVFFIENRDNVSEILEVQSATENAARDEVTLITQARDPAKRYQLSALGLQDLYGNFRDVWVIRVQSAIVIQNDRIADVELSEASPGTQAGGAPTVAVDLDGPGQRQGLLRFDLIGNAPSQVPLGSTITRATLRLYTSDGSDSNAPIRMLRMRVPWDEQSTWNSLGNGIDQTNDVETGSTDGLINGTPDESFDEINVTAAVQGWASQPEANYGWAFLSTSPNGWTWASSENGAAARRPTLIVYHHFVDPWCSIAQHPQSVTVEEGRPFVLSVAVWGTDLRYQWFKDGMPINGATQATYSVARAIIPDQGNYFVEVQTLEAICRSAIATVTVCCGGDAPQLISAIGNPDQTTITLQFNDYVDQVSAGDIWNYSISGGLQIIAATNSGPEVTLTTSAPRALGLNYTVTIRDVRDDFFNVIYPNPTIATLTQDVRVLSFHAVWKYDNSGLDLGTSWKEYGYNDSGWPSGPGLLGVEGTETTITTLSNQNVFLLTPLRLTNESGTGHLTDYFRTLVDVPFYTGGVTFNIRHVTDDGAVFYANGVEIGRFNMPPGPLYYDTRSLLPPPEGVIRSLSNVSGILCGRNLIAVELHQNSFSGTDALFGAEIIARVPLFVAPLCTSELRMLRNADRSLTIFWSPNRVLQYTDALNGDWRDLQNVPNPLHIPNPFGSRFYRLRAF